MPDPERVFIGYTISARSPAAVRSLLQTGLVTVASFVYAWRTIAMSYPDFPVLGGIVLTFGIVAAVVLISVVLNYVRNRDEDIRVTDDCITGASKSWTWDKVLQVDFHRRTRHVFIHLNNGPARTRLSLLVHVPGDDPESVMRELRSFVEAKGILIRDRGA